MKVSIVGSTGATGRHVVQQILDKGHNVVAVARSKETLLSHLKQENYGTRLQIKEASILEMSQEEISSLTKGCTSVVSCLGHNVSFQGLFGHPRRLVKEAVQKLTIAMPQDSKFILMGTDAVRLPEEPERSFKERAVIGLLRLMLPPHVDNEEASSYLNSKNDVDWVIVRPTNLVDEDQPTGNYDIFERSEGPLFGEETVSRANVAHFMVELITNPSTFAKYNHGNPLIIDRKKD